MLDHEIENLTNKIAEKFEGISKTQTPIMQQAYKDLIKAGIEDFFKNQIAVIWTVEDVQSIAKYEKIEMTDDEANEILDIMLSDHDANVGINWESIRYTVLHYKD